MRFKKVISYVILAVYSSVLVHTIIPHDHHTHLMESINAVVDALHSNDDDHHHAEGTSYDHHHDTHGFPHHAESQHPEVYTLSANNPISQLFAALTLYCHAVQTFDLTPKEIEIDKQDIYYVPLKIPIAFTSGVPTRAPPVV